MDTSKKSLFSPAGASQLSAGELESLLERYGWFAPLRILHELRSQSPDAQLDVVAPWRGQSSLYRLPVDIAVLTAPQEDIFPAAAPAPTPAPAPTLAPIPAPIPPTPAVSSDELIDRFLQQTDLRIVAQEGEPDDEVRTAPLLDDEDEVVSERLAEIYLAQGLRDHAVAIYRKLSLLNPEKSVYFAELIGKIENNN